MSSQLHDLLRKSDLTLSADENFSLLSEDDIHLFNEGRHFRLYEKLGSHVIQLKPEPVTYFAVWAPNAREVSVVGNFNFWKASANCLRPRGNSGIWEGLVFGVGPGDVYKYHLVSAFSDFMVDKADPFARRTGLPPETTSIVSLDDHTWNDSQWMAERAERQTLQSAISIYEMHLGSWRREAETGRFLSYREIAEPLTEYLLETGFTHVEFLPLMEHPFFGSWGYQTTGYFAPTSRYGSPEDLMFLIDRLHQAGIGVIFDWVPSHFPRDEHGLAYFDGTHLFEHADPRRGLHRDWDTFIFNYGRNEVRSILLSSAVFWLDRFHGDGLRVDAVASMLYLDYSRSAGEWIPNRFGGREDLEAVGFLRELNEVVFSEYPGVQTIAEESTAWPGVSRPTYLGGLGFGFKWDMGWMHDTLRYFARDPVFRTHHQQELCFRAVYAGSENYALPLSHDEVVHGKGSLIGKMPGDEWQRFANLRLLLGYMFSIPGKKLLFMGGEFAQRSEWNHDRQLEWELLDAPSHRGIFRLVRDLNSLYRAFPALHQRDCDPSGFEWIDADDRLQSVISFLRRGNREHDQVVVVMNCTPVPRTNYRIGVPRSGYWKEVFNSDSEWYGGSGVGNFGGADATPVQWHGRPMSLNLTLPPLGILIFASAGSFT